MLADAFLDLINPFKPTGLSQSYQMYQFISVLSVVGGFFSFNENPKRISCKQTVASESDATFCDISSRSELFAYAQLKER